MTNKTSTITNPSKEKGFPLWLKLDIGVGENNDIVNEDSEKTVK